MRAAVLALLMAASVTHAREPLIPFVEAGVGFVAGGCLYRYGTTDAGLVVNGVECSRSPVAVLAAGVRIGETGLRLQLEHWSAPLDTRDRGVEIFSIRYRHEFR
jgi:hypothetical protein